MKALLTSPVLFDGVRESLKFELQEENIVETLFSLLTDNWENLVQGQAHLTKEKEITKEKVYSLLEQYVSKLKEDDKLSLMYQYISSSIKHVKKLIQLRCENSYGNKEDNKVVQEIEDEKVELETILKKTTSKLFNIVESFNKVDAGYNKSIDDFVEKYLENKGILTSNSNHNNPNLNNNKRVDNENDNLVVINTLSNENNSGNDIKYLSKDLIKMYIDKEISSAKNKIDIVDSKVVSNNLKERKRKEREIELKSSINKLEEDNFIINQYLNNQIVDFSYLDV